ncbi:MAG: cytochrome P450 [Betaproteobacteria bacterium]|nr:cytochrome P450 [Betaproteobacteria bacterium]MCL2886072.1 cytochrome P450 [Betaproteobacteria bacterium]
MAIDYVLKFPCPVRKNMPEEKLITLVGYMNMAEFAVEKIRESNPALSKEDILGCEVHASQKRPDGTVTQVPMTVRQLMELVHPLDPYRGICPPCRANISDGSFGCIAKINYPIRKESEEWLLSRLLGDVNNPNLLKLFRFLTEMKIDGRPVDALRSRSKMFELKEPVVRRWKTAPGQENLVTSSQIIHMLAFFDEEIRPQLAGLYTNLLGLTSVLSDPHPPSSNIEQFKTLMCAIVMSERLNAGIGIEV